MTGLSPKARRRGAAVIKWIFAAAVVVFGGLYIAGRWEQVSGAFARMDPLLVGVAFVLVLVALYAAMQSWRVLWPAFGALLGTRQGARVFFVSQLGKYLPGSVWPIAVQAQMAKELGLSRSASVVLSLISMLVSIAVGLGIGLILVPFIDPGLIAEYWPLLVAGIFLLACLFPPVLTFGVRMLLRVLRRPGTPFLITGRIALTSSGLQAATWAVGGLQLWLIAVALGATPADSLVACLAAFPLAFCIGVLLVPVPAGLGVREAVIVLILTATVAEPTALTAAIVSRVLYAVADFLAAGLAVLFERASRPSVAVDPGEAN